MLGRMKNLGGLFGAPKVDHPLADPRELRNILEELPADNAFKALDEIVGWLESLAEEDLLPARLFEVVGQLDEAAQAHVRRLTRDYLQTPRLPRTEEKRLWNLVSGFWMQLSLNYERCLGTGDGVKALMPLLAGRLVAALASSLKWEQFHYGPISASLWSRLGGALLAAEAAGAAALAVQIYPNQPRATDVRQEYLKAALFQAASMDSLLPFEIELAEKLIGHFLPSFVFGPKPTSDSVYWVDLAGASPPVRLARLPGAMSPSLRFFRPGSAHGEMEALLRDLEQGGDLPPEINLGAQYPTRAVLPVLRHLASHLAPIPPQRQYERHRVKHRISVLGGFANALGVFAGSRPAALGTESWVVEDVSRGGFGASVNSAASDWLQIGLLLALQPEGGDNWLLGIVRRHRRESEAGMRIGIQTLSRQILAVELRPRAASSCAAMNALPALWLLDDNEPGEARFVMPPASFDLGESMEFDDRGRRILLAPVALVERTADYEVARYRLLAAD